MNVKPPLYKQIIVEVERDILAGRLLPGQRIPSIRELAKQYGMNQNTVQRAIREMKYANLLFSLRGKGIFVTENKEHICQFRQNRTEELVHSFLQQMEQLGYSHEQLKK